MTDVVFDQCRFGAAARKPTQLLLNRDDHVQAFHQKFCKHHKHDPHIGVDKHGNFKTAPLAKYPHILCSQLADLAWNYSSSEQSSSFGARNHGVWENVFQAAAFPFEHPADQVATAVHQRNQQFQG